MDHETIDAEALFDELITGLELEMQCEDLEVERQDASTDTMKMFATLLGPTPSTEAIHEFGNHPDFVAQFGPDPSQWAAGIEAVLNARRVKSTIRFGLSGLIRKTSLVYVSQLARRLKKNIRRLKNNPNDNDYTKSISLRLPSYTQTKQILDGLEELQELFAECVRSPKTIDPKELRTKLDKIGISVGKNPFKRTDWKALSGRVIGAALGAVISGGIGALIGLLVGRRISDRGAPIHTRGWKNNDLLLDETERAYSLLGRVSDMQEDAKKLDRIDLDKIPDEEEEKIIEANAILQVCEPAFRKVLGYICSGLGKAVHLTSKDVAEATDKFLEEHYKRKRND